MTNFEVIAEVEDVSVARVLVTALQAHGFHPMEGSDSAFPGMLGITGVRGLLPIKVPEAEANDARMLAKDLLDEMTK